jgi:hypothetical protein
MFLPQYERQIFTLIQNTKQNYISTYIIFIFLYSKLEDIRFCKKWQQALPDGVLIASWHFKICVDRKRLPIRGIFVGYDVAETEQGVAVVVTFLFCIRQLVVCLNFGPNPRYSHYIPLPSSQSRGQYLKPCLTSPLNRIFQCIIHYSPHHSTLRNTNYWRRWYVKPK